MLLTELFLPIEIVASLESSRQKEKVGVPFDPVGPPSQLLYRGEKKQKTVRGLHKILHFFATTGHLRHLMVLADAQDNFQQ